MKGALARQDVVKVAFSSVNNVVMAHPVVSRRREVGGGSARSLLMTVLGEFVLPMDGPVWTSALVDALGLFGVEVKSARQALARIGAEGWLESERVGRRVRWRLTKPASGC